jgi:S1-C subfamily serine protease
MPGEGSRSDRKGVSTTRRGLLGSLATAGVTGLAGCGGTRNPDATTGSPTADASATPTAGVVTTETVPTATGTPERVSIPPEQDGTLRDRVARVGNAIRPAVAVLATGGAATDAAGVFLGPSLVVTVASALVSETPELRTRDGRTTEATLIGETDPSDDGDDVAALRVETTGPTLPRGSAADLSSGEVVIHVGHEFRFRDWVIQFGRVSGPTDGGERFRAFFPLPTPGGPVVTLDGRLVGITAETVPTDPPATDVPPPTAAPTVYTDRQRWVEVQHEPLADVHARVTEWTS